MLKLIFGRNHVDEEKFYLDSRIYFKKHKKPEWFSDPFVQKFLKEIDGSTVLFEEALKDYRGRGISTEMISTGCKTLCCIYYTNDGTIFYGSLLGDNCIPFLVEIAEQKDVILVLEHYLDFPEEVFSKNLLVDNNGILYTQDTYDDAYDEWVGEVDNEDE